MKDLTVTKNIKEIKFEGVYGELELKKMFPDTIAHIIFGNNCIFMWNSGEDWALGYHSMKVRHFPDFF